MRIWVTEIGEPSPLEKGARLLRYGGLTREWTAGGDEVVWWTSTFSHAPRRHVRVGSGDVAWEGGTLRFIDGPGYQSSISLARVRHQKLFAAELAKRFDHYPAPDVILSSVPTLDTAKAAVAYGLKHGVPVIVDIRDEWPEEFVELAPRFLRPVARGLLKSLFDDIRFICSGASGIVAMSERQLQYGLSYSGRERRETDAVFPHGYSERPQDPEALKAAHAWWKQFGLRDGVFTACFFGTIGQYFDLESVIEAARALQDEFPLQIVLCGDGSHIEPLRKLAKGAPVHFPGWMDSPRIAALMELSHAGLAPYKSGTRMSLPNKPFEYLAGGLPVISSIEGEFSELIKQHGCGVSYTAQDITGLKDALRELAYDPDAAKQMGARGRALLLERFTLEKIAQRFRGHLAEVAENHTPLVTGSAPMRTRNSFTMRHANTPSST